MSINEWLKQSQNRLKDAGIATARLDSLVLMEDVLGKDRAWLLANSDMVIQSKNVGLLTNLLNKRVQHMPLAYVRGKTEFYGREFIISPKVMEPRPETETMIDLLKTLPNSAEDVSIADVGTGCGAIGITAALELPKAQVELIDIDTSALKVAKTNVDKFTLNISIINSDLLAKTDSKYDVLLCNLPYVPDNFQINQAAGHEPKLAIFAGSDGLDVYRKLFKQITALKIKPLYILTEAMPPQHDILVAIVAQAGYELQACDDFIQVFCRSEIKT